MYDRVNVWTMTLLKHLPKKKSSGVSRVDLFDEKFKLSQAMYL